MPLHPENGGGKHAHGPAGAHSGPPAQVQLPPLHPSATSESHAFPQPPQ